MFHGIPNMKLNIRPLIKLEKAIPALAVLMLIPHVTLRAQDNLSTDRPGIGNGSYVLETKITYLESGVEYFDTGSLTEVSLGQILFRHGLTDGVELRVLLNSLVIQSSDLVDETGFTDPAVGLKARVWEGERLRLSGLGEISAPVGASELTADEWVPSFALLADYSLTEYWTLSWNAGYTVGTGGLDDVWLLTVTPGYSVPGNSGVGFYAGYAGFYSGSGDEHFIEGGITKRLQPFLQIDLNGGVDADSGAGFVSSGVVLRF